MQHVSVEENAIEPDGVSRDLLGSDLDRGSNFAGTDSQNGVPAQL